MKVREILLFIFLVVIFLACCSTTATECMHAMMQQYTNLSGISNILLNHHSPPLLLGHLLLADLRVLVRLSKLAEEAGMNRMGCHFHIYHRKLNVSCCHVDGVSCELSSASA